MMVSLNVGFNYMAVLMFVGFCVWKCRDSSECVFFLLLL